MNNQGLYSIKRSYKNRNKISAAQPQIDGDWIGIKVCRFASTSVLKNEYLVIPDYCLSAAQSAQTCRQ